MYISGKITGDNYAEVVEKFADAEAQIDQDLGYAAHPGATDADEVNVLYLVFHFLHTSSHTRATSAAAPGFASERARSAICNNWPRV